MNLIKRLTAPSQVAWAAPLMFEYDTSVIHTGLDDDLTRLDQYLNAKALLGWRVHTCQRIGDGSYFVVLDRLRRGEGR
jgi:hypothetical protein